MRSLLALHGAGSGPWVYERWEDAVAPDLQAGLNVAEASMLNYEAAAVRAAEGLPRPLVLAGWGMGGLVALMAARRVELEALVLLEPSPPREVRGSDDAVEPEPGTYDPEPFPEPFIERRRPDSGLARAERARGVSVPELPARTLVVHGGAYPPAWGAGIARRYGVEVLHLPGVGHWDLVLATAPRDAVLAWAAQPVAASSDSPSDA